jgi:protein phosphatase
MSRKRGNLLYGGDEMQTTLRFAVQSQTGLRSNNEDAAFAGPRLLALDERTPSPDILADLRGAVGRANAAIARHTKVDPRTAGMGTTLTALLFAERCVAMAHVGDSRAYLLRDGSLSQITHDDTMVQSLVDEGQLTPDEAAVHSQRNVVLKVLTGHTVEPLFELRETDPGDRYLICSDGLSDYVPAAEIASVLELPDPQRRPQELIRMALRNGGQDNITCVVGDVTEGPTGYNISVLTGAAGSRVQVVQN